MPEIADGVRKQLEGLTWDAVDAADTGAGRDQAIPPLRQWRRTIAGVVTLWFPFACYQAWHGTSPRGPASILVWFALSWALLATCHLIANGRAWIWLAVSLFPPLGLAAIPALLLAAAFAVRGTAGIDTALLAIAAFVTTGRQTGINLGPLARTRLKSSGGRYGSRPVRVMSWNTQYWHQFCDPDEFYSYLRGWDADIYLLQEYLYHSGNWRYRLLDDDQRLSAAFSDYQVAISGQLVTISRLPIVGTPAALAPHLLRVDLQTAGHGPVLSVWRLDWVFTAGRVLVHQYEFANPDGRSDHRIQWLLVTAD